MLTKNRWTGCLVAAVAATSFWGLTLEPLAHSQDTAAPPAASAPAAAAPATALRLDGAKRWKADEHTKQAVAALKARLADPALHGQALGDALDKEVQALVRGCTMDGEAHNQLHHWLLPLIDQIKGVQQGKEGAAEQVRASVAAFEAHFE